MNTEKTIAEWLQELPEPHKSKAVSNLTTEAGQKKSATLHDAINEAFNWKKTKEFAYWRSVYHNAKAGHYVGNI